MNAGEAPFGAPLLFWVALAIALLLQMGRAADPAFHHLQERLIGDGLDSAWVAQSFDQAEIRFLPRVVELNLVSREFPDAYRGFLSEDAIQDGRHFWAEKKAEIKAALAGTRVSPEVAVAILKLESDLGRRSGKYPILGAFATITLLADSIHWVARYDTSGGADLPRLERRARARADWAYNELKQFMRLCADQNWNPAQVKGSWAGAFGWTQFLPSSFARCAQDGNHDGVMDPFTLQDAIASTAFYLRESGWGISAKSQRRALLAYNPSSAYVDCVLEYASRLRAADNQNSSPHSPSSDRAPEDSLENPFDE